MPVYFTNPGQIDIRAVTTLGVNAKADPSAIGYFGTGLKYALAVLLREGHQVEIFSGQEHYHFSTQQEEIRGKSFSFIYLWSSSGRKELGFTTDLGKNWTLASAYRELWSNCKDEQGRVTSSQPTSFDSSYTMIIITGRAFEEVHQRRSQIILAEGERELLLSTPNLEIYSGNSSEIFYKGIAAYRLSTQSKLTYNLLSPMTLTEDRTLASAWDLKWKIGTELAHNGTEEILREILAAKGFFEHELDYDWSSNDNVAFYKVAEELYRTDVLSLSDSVKSALRRRTPPKALEPEALILDKIMEEEIASAIAICEASGYLISTYPVKVADKLANGVLAQASNRTIWLSRQVFSQGILLECLLEEFFHLDHKVSDYSREMQDLLFKELAFQIGRK